MTTPTEVAALMAEMRQSHSEDVRWWVSDLAAAVEADEQRVLALVDAARWLVEKLPDPGGLIDPLLAALEQFGA